MLRVQRMPKLWWKLFLKRRLFLSWKKIERLISKIKKFDSGKNQYGKEISWLTLSYC